MFDCFFIKRKLYDYTDKSLSEAEDSKVKEHLKNCPACQKKLSQLQGLLKAAESKTSLEPKAEFWHNFHSELDRKLNARLVPEFKLRRAQSFRLKPVLAYASISVIVLGLAIHLLNYNSPAMRVARLDEKIVKELSLLDELESSPSLGQDEEAYLDELDLLDQLQQSPA